MKKFKRYSLLLLLALFLIILIIIFLWNEEIDTDKLVDSNKIAAFFTILAAISTSMTVFLLYKQVEEMFNSRNASYQPELFFHDKIIFTQDLPNPRILPLGSKKIMPFVVGFNDHGSTDKFYANVIIELHNIGLGLAKKINIQWVYDIQAVNSYINNNYDTYQINEKNSKIDFVMVNDHAKIRMPYSFMQLYGIKLAPPEIFPDVVKEKPSIKVLLSYQNSFGKIYDNSFDVMFEQENDKISIRFEEKLQ